MKKIVRRYLEMLTYIETAGQFWRLNEDIYKAFLDKRLSRNDWRLLDGVMGKIGRLYKWIV